MKILINNKEYDIILAKTDEEKEKGLQEVEEMDDDEGMLFIYDKPQTLDFWMKDTDISLDIIFISPDWIVNSVEKGVPKSEEIISGYNSQYVLELNMGSKVLPGMEVEILEFDDDFDDDINPNMMYIIGTDGKPQMELEGGERIFSRPNTKTLINMAKRAFKSDKDSDYKRLGKKIFDYLKIQDNNEPDYVDE